MRIKTLLIANRGEIACRIARTARALGIAPIGVHSDADAKALHVREIGRSLRIGPGPAAESYLRIEAVIAAARQASADAIHPGYGFLAENPDFARAVEAAGMIFVGPTVDTLQRFGDKASAKTAAIAAGVPVIPGSDGVMSDALQIAQAVREVGLPALLKAVGGGGGRGQRLIENETTLNEDIESAQREAKSTFGSEGLLLERFLPEARHVEIQIAGDGKGRVLHLFERDCTLQRRHQKVIEEAPAWGLPRPFLDRIAQDAVRLAEGVNYRGLGTVEFLVLGEQYFFLEVNPRIQVEHPVTEAVTGLDLVALQIRIAEGAGLGLTQDQITCTGHAVEARLYAEDPRMQFAPSTGLITALSLPSGLRIDSGVEAGDSVSPFYDPMVAKLVVHDSNRDAALAKLARALDHVVVDGIETNRDFLAALARNADFARMHVHTRWIDGCVDALVVAPQRSDERLWQAVAAVLFVTSGRRDGDANPWQNRDKFTGWRLGLGSTLGEAGQRVIVARSATFAKELRISPVRNDRRFVVYSDDSASLALQVTELQDGSYQVTHEDEAITIEACVRGSSIEIDTPCGRHVYQASTSLAFAEVDSAADRILLSPLTGKIVKVLVNEGTPVAAGEVVAILESMKLEISIKAMVSGVAKNISISQGAMVDRGQPIVEIALLESEVS